METGWILLPDTFPTLETFRKRPRRVPMVFPSPTSTRNGYGHINGVPLVHSWPLPIISKFNLPATFYLNFKVK
ncbi:hypothetical protein Hanom_Chr12g01090111 [Helianthus anomalus]